VIEKSALAYSVLIMKPHVYNMRYEQIQGQGGSLNVLLALGHIAALKQAWKKYPRCSWALGDQFAKNESIPKGVRAFAPDMQVFQRPRAEEDIAVAAASVLAKTYRDDYMLRLHEEYPMYHWDENKGYPTAAHYEAIQKYGVTKYHRKSFRLVESQKSKVERPQAKPAQRLKKLKIKKL
jgi:ribonuclease HII